MTKKEILDYVMENPGNTNVSVLGPMVDAVSGVTPTGKITITENRNGIDVAQYAKADVAVPNPNKVVTVTGTIANPWGDLDFADLRSGFLNNTLSVWLTATMGGSTMIPLAPRKDTSAGLYFSFISVLDDFSPDNGVVIHYGEDGLLFEVVSIEHGVGADYSGYANLIPTELTVIYHPLPEV
jgi:hypothetical protein